MNVPLAIALVLSLGAHVVRGSGSEPQGAGPIARGSVSAGRGDANGGTGAAELDEVDDESEEAVGRRPAGASAPRVGIVHRSQAQRLESATGAEAQDEALCEKAKSTLREGWTKDRRAIGASLERSLGDAREQDKNVREKTAAMRKSLGLRSAEAPELESAYGALRSARVAEAMRAYETDPPDLEVVFEAAKLLFEDEDELVESYGGAAGVAEWREDELEGRTIVLALLAAIAELEWDDELHW